jgi:SPP1 family predicted phage head-tail adaptor
MRFRERITLQSQTRSTFVGGCFTCTWGTVGTYWAEVSEEGGEEYTAEKGQQKTILKILMRYNVADIDKKTQRLIFNGRIAHIKSVNDKTNRQNIVTIIGEVEEDAT